MNVRRLVLLSNRPRLLATGVAAVAIVALMATGSTYSAFSATTANSGNSVGTGTVSMTDNDSGAALFSLSGMVPGDSVSGCITVTYTGSLPALVRLRQATTGSGLGAYLELTITRGTGLGAFGSCTGFVPDTVDYAGLGNGIVYNGTLAGLGTDWTGGLADPKTATVPEAWTNGEAHDYKLQMVLRNDNDAQTKDATTTFTWEARNTDEYAQVVLSDRPAGYWKLDETAGTSAADAAGTNAGTYSGGPTLNQPSGVKDAATAVTFDGTDDYVNGTDAFDFSGTAPFSVEFWVNPTAATSQWRRIVAKEDSNQYGWRVVLVATGMAVPNQVSMARTDAAGTDRAESPGALEPGTWYHVVSTYDGGTLRMYLDGALVDSRPSTRSIPDHASPFLMARRTGSVYTSVTLDEVALYDFPLSQQQVTEHYGAGHS